LSNKFAVAVISNWLSASKIAFLSSPTSYTNKVVSTFSTSNFVDQCHSYKTWMK